MSGGEKGGAEGGGERVSGAFSHVRLLIFRVTGDNDGADWSS